MKAMSPNLPMLYRQLEGNSRCVVPSSEVTRSSVDEKITPAKKYFPEQTKNAMLVPLQEFCS